MEIPTTLCDLFFSASFAPWLAIPKGTEDGLSQRRQDAKKRERVDEEDSQSCLVFFCQSVFLRPLVARMGRKMEGSGCRPKILNGDSPYSSAIASSLRALRLGVPFQKGVKTDSRQD
jgi:hypothetical protein